MMQAFVFFQINGLCTAYAYAMNADSFQTYSIQTPFMKAQAIQTSSMKAHTIQSSFMKVHTMQSYPIDAYSVNDDINYDDIQEVIDNIMKREDAINFGDYVNKLMSGEEAFSLAAIGSKLIQSVNGEISAHIAGFGRLISISLIAAIFTNLSMAFKYHQVSETGYYVTYLLLFGLLISSFINASNIASNVIGQVLDFMKALVPAYYMSVAFSSGSMSSFAFYKAALIIITLVDFIIMKVVIPLVSFYLIIILANNLSKEDMLSKLAGLLEIIIQWTLRSLLAAVVGFQAIQGLIMPVADQVKRSALLKVSSALPGVGNALGSVAETVIGAGLLLKNAIGVAGLVVIIIICSVPIMQLIVVTLIYKFSSAALQPISDKRIIECISASAKSSQMLLQCVIVGAILFILSITIVAISTGRVI
ncbi:MAG TPA: stage III sporulation protein AF [Clostridiales bacterium]|jgi:stage III sporulation protein AE|nr:stage III sporulation protein AF [Clostridiales bacterium]